MNKFSVNKAQISFCCIILVLFVIALMMRPFKVLHVVTFDLEFTTVEVQSTVPDFSSIIDVNNKKSAFFGFIQPYVENKNAQILAERKALHLFQRRLEQGYPLNNAETQFVYTLASHYKVSQDESELVELIPQLLNRVDVLPSALVLSQAANESAWGTSRFAQQGKNFFGQWCYVKGCGMIPVRRESGLRHEVQHFVSVADSVNAYFMNLNTFASYQTLRDIRQVLRQKGLDIDGISLSEGLSRYSERGNAYIKDLQSIMRSNNLL